MRVIGLTGSIACGKSTVSNWLISGGFPVVDGDRIARELTVPGSPVLRDIQSAFGSGMFNEDGSLNRRRLGRLVFSDSSARQKLDSLMAPYLLSETRRRLGEARSAGAELCFLDMPLLFEKGYDRLCDSVWTVWLPQETQIARLMQRDGYTREEALSRIRAVLSSDEKAARSDAVIDNSGSLQQTFQAVSDQLARELSASEAGSPRSRIPDGTRSPAPEAPAMSAVMERPRAAEAKKAPRKAAWRLPLWLRISLISLTVFLAAGITAQLLMNGYLRTCMEKHAAEQKHIDDHYPLLYRDLIGEYASEFNLSPAFVASVIRNESSFQSRAESGVGARGLMQLMPDTAEWIAQKLNVNGYAFERMFDPETNIRFGCWYLNYLSRLFLGDPVSVTAAYHAGQGQVKVWLSDPLLSEDGFTLPLDSLPEGPTKNYAAKVVRDYGIYRKKYYTPALSVDDHPASSSAGVAGLVGETR